MRSKIILIVIFVLVTGVVYGEDKSEQSEVYQLGEISVSPGRFSIGESSPSLYIIPKSQMDKLPLIDNDIYRVVQNLPGVVSDDFSARFSLRGGDRNEITVRLDGMELFDPYHLQDFGGAISIIDLGIVRQADLFTGGFPAEYGDAMSGILDITSGSEVIDKIKGNAGIDLINASMIINAPIFNSSLLTSIRTGYIDLLMGLMQSDEIFKPKYYDVYNKFIHNISPSDLLSVYVLYAGDSDLIDRIGLEDDIESDYKNGMIWGRWNHLINDKSYWNSYVFFGKANRDKKEGIDGKDIRSASYFGLKDEISYGISKDINIKSGFRWQFATADYDYYLNKNDVITSVNTNVDGWDMNGYVQSEWNINKWLASNVGLRFLYQNFGGYYSIMPRIALAFRPSNNITFRSAYGKYDQPVQVINLPVEEGVDSPKPLEKATHYVLSAEYMPKSNFLIKTEAYYKQSDNLIGRIINYGRKERYFISPKSGTAKGIELYINQSPLPRLSYGLGYALSKSDVKTDTETIPRDYDRRHSFTLNVDYAVLVDGWINLIWRYHSGDPYTKSWYEKVGDKWEKKYGTPNSDRLPPYHSLDVRFTKNYQFKKWSLNFYFQIMNLYNRKNVHEYSFSEMTDAEGNVYYQKNTEGFLPILPTLGLNVQF
ncbi:TPA: hypothetical protein ENX78_02755 [Candidatus Poribacteria bacterium]|nr:hypothetical protein [Candidatus Poribacteria bacterium]